MSLFRVSMMLAALIGLGFLFPPAQAQPPKGEAPKPPKVAPRPPLQVKVFRLERANPEEFKTHLDPLLGPMDEMLPDAPPLPAGLGNLGFAGGIGIAGGFGGAGGCIVGGGLGFPYTAPLWRSSIDQRIKAVIIRGAAEHIRVTADLVSLLDRPANTPIPKLLTLQAFELKHAHAAELHNIFNELQFDDLGAISPTEKLLVVRAREADRPTVAELVKELDTPTKGDPDPPPVKKE